MRIAVLESKRQRKAFPRLITICLHGGGRMTVQLRENLDAGAGSDPGRSRFEHHGRVGKRPDAARGFHSRPIACSASQQGDIIRGRSPDREKPVLVFRKSAPAESARSAARSFSSNVRRQVSRITLTMAPKRGQAPLRRGCPAEPPRSPPSGQTSAGRR